MARIDTHPPESFTSNVPDRIAKYVEKWTAHQTELTDPPRSQLSRDVATIDQVLKDLYASDNVVRDMKLEKTPKLEERGAHFESRRQVMLLAAALRMQEKEFLVLMGMAEKEYQYSKPRAQVSLTRQYQTMLGKSNALHAAYNVGDPSLVEQPQHGSRVRPSAPGPRERY